MNCLEEVFSETQGFRHQFPSNLYAGCKLGWEKEELRKAFVQGLDYRCTKLVGGV